ncbi:hypothetical protein C8F01DRAFT_1258907 [Mycena amicta]|nr:hypothetical protein C8F01DRAFT_1258907 [Mycena amicta]
MCYFPHLDSNTAGVVRRDLVALRWGTQNDRVYSTKVLTLRESGAHDAPCDPKVDSSFVDHPHQPYTHSLRILLKHGKKRDNFVIFVKRGHDATKAPYLMPNNVSTSGAILL